MTKRIEWKVPQEPLTAVLEVRITGGPLAIPPSDATIDDLRKACEAVGLHVVDEGSNWKDQSIKDWAELARRQTVWLGDVRKALDPNATSHADIESMASATVAARGLAMAAAEKAEAENVTLRAQLAAAAADQSEAEDRIDTLESQLAALTSPEGRATDEELEELYQAEWHAGPDHVSDSRRLAIRAVAARVRRERPACLVERLVAKGYDFEVEEEGGGYWTVAARSAATPVSCRTKAEAVPAAEVPATLARLAGLGEK